MIWTKSRITELGLSAIGCDPEKEISSFNKLPAYEKERDIRDSGLMKSRYLDRSRSATAYFLVHGDHAHARKWAEISVEAAETYFFGEWKDIQPSGNGRNQPPSREYQDIHELWVDDFDWSMCFLAALKRWSEFERFARYLRDDVRLNVDQTEAHRAWWLYFCGKVRKRPQSELHEFRQTVVEAKRAKTDQLLLAWVDALFDGTDADLRNAIDVYFQHHRKVETKKPGLGLAVRGSLLLHYGNHLGRPIPRPENADLYIVEFAE